ncbi:hypothetical protein ACI2IX_19990 [Leifsonia aquatica]|uniref:hypothetical protein n=1 Tax=Leifsonia aquatica TaxID=144185 RepID=UPI00384DA631
MTTTPLTRIHPDDDPDAPLCGCGRRHWDHVDDDDREDDLASTVRRCRSCGCTDTDCSGCIVRTGQPCSWSTAHLDLCTACVTPDADDTPAALFRSGAALQTATYRYTVDPFDWRELRVQEVVITIGSEGNPSDAQATVLGSPIRPDGTRSPRKYRAEIRYADNPGTVQYANGWEHAPAELVHLVDTLRALTACTRRDTSDRTTATAGAAS